jgi:hypothetical protein
MPPPPFGLQSAGAVSAVAAVSAPYCFSGFFFQNLGNQGLLVGIHLFTV